MTDTKPDQDKTPKEIRPSHLNQGNQAFRPDKVREQEKSQPDQTPPGSDQEAEKGS